MKRTHILLLLAATLAAGACAPDQPAQTGRQPIRLTSVISPTRGVQDSQIATGQTVYVWAQEGSDWGTPDGFIQGWELTAGSGGALTPSNGLTYYYPPQPLSLIALHGNFSFADGQTPFPGIVSHSVLSDQSTAGNLEKSDLLHCRLDDVSASASPVGVAFAHKLSKIEITLSSSLYSAAELDAMTVTLNNVLPTVDLVLSSGAVGVAHGNTIAVHPRKTATAANSGSAVFEAVIPAQPRPADFITVRLDGGVVNVDAQVSEFEANTRYPYDLDLAYLDVRLNPLWYVAEYNVNYDGSSSYSWASTLDEGYYFSWNDAQKAFTTAGNAAAATPASISGYYGDSGSKFAGWHLPTLTEWLSIVPGNQENIWEFDTGSGTYKATNTTVSFGYNKDTQAGMAEASYWKRASSTEMHALRYLGTPYCSAWRYVWANNMLTIYATLVGNVSASAAAASAWYTANWSGVFWGNNAAAGAVQRSLYLSGCITSGSGSTGVVEHDLNGRYQCATKDGSNVQTLCISAQVGYMYSTAGVAYGRHTRLFRVVNNDGSAFSVSANKKVVFSPGNLQAYVSSGPTNTYVYAANNWRFAANQWDCSNKNLAVGNWVDLFSWVGNSASYNSFGLCSLGSYNNAYHGNSDTEALRTDWGAIPGVVSALGSGWRTPTMDDWVYLLSSRTTESGVRYAKATVNGIAGVILVPDGWSTSYYTLASPNTATVAFTVNNISSSVWDSSFKPHGAVFLPAAGSRNAATSGNVGVHGFYWSGSTVSSTTNAYTLYFNSSTLVPANSNGRYVGFSVRLVHDI